MRPEIKEFIRSSLSLVMNEQEAEKYMDLGYAIDTIKRGQTCWQAPVSVGVHTAVVLLLEGKDEDGKAVLQDLIGHALEPLEALLETLEPKPGENPLEDERARIQFHTRFALGTVLLAKAVKERAFDKEELWYYRPLRETSKTPPGDRDRASFTLRDMAETETRIQGGWVSSGGLRHSDVVIVKILAAQWLHSVLAEEQDYDTALCLINGAVESCEPGRRSGSPLERVPELLDSFAEKCEATGNISGWGYLFDKAAWVVGICGEGDTAGCLPSSCRTTSPQFLSWKFGQLVARFATRCGLPLREGGLQAALSELDDFELSSWRNGTVVASLLCECDGSRNWQAIRERCVFMWERSGRYQWVYPQDAGPYTDLYWAMRIGFADRMLEATAPQALVSQQITPQHVVSEFESMKKILSTIALQQLKQRWDDEKRHEELLQRLPPAKREILQHLQQRLGEVGRELPSRVVNTLVKAERYYRSKVDDDDAKVWFAKAVEASLRCCLVEPLTNFMQTKGHSHIAICFPAPHPGKRMSATGLSKLSLPEWSDVLETLAAPSHESLASLGTNDLREFMSAHLGGPRLPDFRPLARSLHEVQQYRSGSAHFEDAITRYDKEKWELEQMRNLVLGIDKASVISQIFQLLSAKK